jgi:hypothetical protein
MIRPWKLGGGVIRFSETSVNIRTTQRYIPEDDSFQWMTRIVNSAPNMGIISVSYFGHIMAIFKICTNNYEKKSAF